jgi:hypothetical protein
MSAGAGIFLIFIVLLFFAAVYGSYTRRGSGINQRPHDSNREGAASGAAGRSRISSAEDENEGVPDTHGTK